MSDADVVYLRQEKARAVQQRRLEIRLPDPKVIDRIFELGGTWPITPQELLEMLEARHG